jgi:ATP/maltotriose-dependent transcriptional regulator MalT
MQGLALKEIAFRLSISLHTADCHTRSIYCKLTVHSRAELFKHFTSRQEIQRPQVLVNSDAARIFERLELIETKMDGLAQLLGVAARAA